MLAFVLIAHHAGAAESEFDARIRFGTIWSDNVFLSSPGNETDDLIYSISPALNFSYQSTPLDANLDYEYSWFKYSDIDADAEQHNYIAGVTGKAFDEALQVEVGARRQQALGDPLGAISSRRVPFGNQVDQDFYFVNPRFEQVIGESTALRVGYEYSELRYDGQDFQDTASQIANFSLNNNRRGRGFTWGFRYRWEQADYDLSPVWEHQSAAASVGFWASSNVRLFASGGSESPWDSFSDKSLSDGFWEAGLAYAAGDRLRAEFAAGERTFGSSWRGELDFRFRRGNLSLAYAERPTTRGFRDDGGHFTEFRKELGAINDFLNTPGTAERYVREELGFELDLEFRRTAVNIGFTDENRTNRFSADGTRLEDELQRGVRALVSWQVGARTEVLWAGSFITREFGEPVYRDDFLEGSLEVAYALTRRASLSLSYARTEQRPKSESAFAEYVENFVSLQLTLSL